MGTPLLFVGFLSLFALASTQEQYYGKYLGDFINQEHNVNGRVFAADFRTLVLVNFTYDGAGPDAFFWAGKKGISGPMPNTNGAIIPDENGNSQTKLKAYNQATLILRLPAELPLNQIQWLSVWCRRFSVNFGYILFTDAMTSNLPAPRNVGQFSQKAHGVRSGMVTVLDAKTIRIQNFHYDGTGPDAFFLVGSGSNPSASGVYYKVPDETGSLQTVRGYQGQTFELILPDPITVFDIDWLSLYCITYTENFGEVFFPDNAIRRSIIPPHLASLPVRVDEGFGRQGYVQGNANRNQGYALNGIQRNQGYSQQNGNGRYQGYSQQNDNGRNQGYNNFGNDQNFRRSNTGGRHQNFENGHTGSQYRNQFNRNDRHFN